MFWLASFVLYNNLGIVFIHSWYPNIQIIRLQFFSFYSKLEEMKKHDQCQTMIHFFKSKEFSMYTETVLCMYL